MILDNIYKYYEKSIDFQGLITNKMGLKKKMWIRFLLLISIISYGYFIYSINSKKWLSAFISIGFFFLFYFSCLHSLQKFNYQTIKETVVNDGYVQTYKPKYWFGFHSWDTERLMQITTDRFAEHLIENIEQSKLIVLREMYIRKYDLNKFNYNNPFLRFGTISLALISIFLTKLFEKGDLHEELILLVLLEVITVILSFYVPIFIKIFPTKHQKMDNMINLLDDIILSSK